MPGWGVPMAAAMSRSEPVPVVLRFDRAERWGHRAFALLMGVCLATAALLYLPGLGGIVGQRDVVRMVHLVAGFALPVPLVLGYAASGRFRADTRRLGRFTEVDWRWLRAGDRRAAALPVGKFNAGQKLNSAFTVGALIVMVATGAVMTFASAFPDHVRTGATFTHDWVALAVAVVLAGHVYMAYGDPGARAGMRTGVVTAQWAATHHPGWLGGDDADPRQL
ncbi:MAG: formate dehydrogenase subunit gamma [Actinomycetota bacterium]|nr:formate dehydrogenase subunit gamma [Actinomycetota bacterium]